jgi:uncharacterized membrane protein
LQADGWRSRWEPPRGDQGRDIGAAPLVGSRRYAALSYALGAFTGVIVLVLKREDRFVQFHALQSVAATVIGLAIAFVLWIFSYFPIFGFLYQHLFQIYRLVLLFLWLALMAQAYRGRWFRIPRLGTWVERQML